MRRSKVVRALLKMGAPTIQTEGSGLRLEIKRWRGSVVLDITERDGVFLVKGGGGEWQISRRELARKGLK